MADYPARRRAQPLNGDQRFDLRLWLAWIAATTVGWAVAEFVYLVFVDAFAVAVWLRGDAGVGVFVAVLQALVLRRRLTQPAWWILASGIGGVLGPLAGVYVNATVYAAYGVHGVYVTTVFLTALGAGILIGALQWLVTRRQVARAAWWVPVSGLGMVAGTSVGRLATGVVLSIISDIVGEEINLTVFDIATGFVGATILAAITGYALVRLLQSPAPDAGDALSTLR